MVLYRKEINGKLEDNIKCKFIVGDPQIKIIEMLAT